MKKQGAVKAKAKTSMWAPALVAGLFATSAFVAATQVKGEEDTIVSHAYSFFGDAKYPADYPHLDYVNPDAPKGGEISVWAQGTYDSFNPGPNAKL